jgi:hypothetical protein
MTSVTRITSKSAPNLFETDIDEYFVNRRQAKYENFGDLIDGLFNVPSISSSCETINDLDLLNLQGDLVQENVYPMSSIQDSSQFIDWDRNPWYSNMNMENNQQATKPSEIYLPIENAVPQSRQKQCASFVTPEPEINSELEEATRLPTRGSRRMTWSPTLPVNLKSPSPKLRTAQMHRKLSLKPNSSISKTNHNQVERHYRNRMNSHFKQLLSSIAPEFLDANGIGSTMGQKHVTKSDTLNLAAQYIGFLNEQERELSNMKKRLSSEFERLKEEWTGLGGVVMP